MPLRRVFTFATALTLTAITVAYAFEIKLPKRTALKATVIANELGEGLFDAKPARVEVVGLPEQASPVRAQLVGFTVATLAGDSGFFTLTLTCQAEFPSSHVCTSREVLGTEDIPVLAPPPSPGDGAWVRPSFVPVAIASGATVTQRVGLDESGIAENGANLTCEGWRSSNATGLIVDHLGRFRTFPCAEEAAQRVACCAPTS